MKEVKNKTKVEKRREQKKKMKNKKILILSIIINLVFLLIICIFISGYKNIIREKKVIKEMTTSTLEENLNAQITQLNKSHTDYANSIEESKKKIASAITEKGVDTSSDVTLDTMADNIRNISTIDDASFVPLLINGNWVNNANLISLTGKGYGGGASSINSLGINLKGSSNQTNGEGKVCIQIPTGYSKIYIQYSQSADSGSIIYKNSISINNTQNDFNTNKVYSSSSQMGSGTKIFDLTGNEEYVNICATNTNANNWGVYTTIYNIYLTNE